jgi:chromosome segregation ATPase
MAINDNLKLVDQTLTSSEDILSTVSQVVDSTATNMASLQETTGTISSAIHNSDPMLDTIINMTGNDIPTAINTTQSSLASAQTSALIIDNVLSALTSVPFSSISPYKPAVPLHTALMNVSDSLNELKPSLITITQNLVSGKANLQEVDSELQKITETSQGINTSLGTAQTDVMSYKSAITQLKKNVEAAQEKVVIWMKTLTWIITALLVWTLLLLAGVGFLGLSMIQLRYHPEVYSEYR